MTAGTPTVYFIDDSATMRAVIKIAFRRENIEVLPCHDGDSALAQMEQVHPDVVISDVIMPDKDGYQVCEYIKNHPKFADTPVILMSGVVNRAVAERASAVKADELIRKPFQPQDLITRVKQLLNPRAIPAAAPPAVAISANAALSSIFSVANTGTMATARLAASMPRAAASAPLAAERIPFPTVMEQPGPTERAVNSAPTVPPPTMASLPVSRAATLAPVNTPVAAMPQGPASPAPASAPVTAAPQPFAAPAAPVRSGIPLDIQKMKIEILRLEGLVRKLQSELQAEREYSQALEAHVKTLQEAE